MRLASYRFGGVEGLAVDDNGELRGVTADHASYPGSVADLIAASSDLVEVGKALLSAPVIDASAIEWLPPLPGTGKIICIGLNYVDHSTEAGFALPGYPTIFCRFASSLTGHKTAIRLPPESNELDFEAELVAVIGKSGRRIAKDIALSHVAGYSVFNDASVRDYQFKSPQWTAGKNFDGTGAFGPFLVTADALPPGCAGLHIQARLNGLVVQSANTDDMIFSVAELVSTLSGFMTLHPGDIVVTGTPAGVGMARDPKLWMKDDDLIEIEIDQVGLLTNTVLDEFS